MMEFETLFEINLSEIPLNGKNCLKIARIIQGTGYTKRNDIPTKFSIVRLELRVQFDKTVPIDVQLSNKDLHWFMNCIKRETEYSLHAGRKMLQFVTVGDGTFTLSSIDNSKCFGIQLSKFDLEKIIQNGLLFELLLENQKISGKELEKLTTDLFIGVLGEDINKIIKSKCNACMSNDENLKHDCKVFFRERPDNKKLIDEIMNNDLFEVRFSNCFEKIMNVLNVQSYDRVEQMQILLPNLKKDFDYCIQKLGYFLDLKDSDSNTLMHVMKLL